MTPPAIPTRAVSSHRMVGFNGTRQVAGHSRCLAASSLAVTVRLVFEYGMIGFERTRYRAAQRRMGERVAEGEARDLGGALFEWDAR